MLCDGAHTGTTEKMLHSTRAQQAPWISDREFDLIVANVLQSLATVYERYGSAYSYATNTSHSTSGGFICYTRDWSWRTRTSRMCSLEGSELQTMSISTRVMFPCSSCRDENAHAKRFAAGVLFAISSLPMLNEFTIVVMDEDRLRLRPEEYVAVTALSRAPRLETLKIVQDRGGVRVRGFNTPRIAPVISIAPTDALACLLRNPSVHTLDLRVDVTEDDGEFRTLYAILKHTLARHLVVQIYQFQRDGVGLWDAIAHHDHIRSVAVSIYTGNTSSARHVSRLFCADSRLRRVNLHLSSLSNTLDDAVHLITAATSYSGASMLVMALPIATVFEAAMRVAKSHPRCRYDEPSPGDFIFVVECSALDEPRIDRLLRTTLAYQRPLLFPHDLLPTLRALMYLACVAPTTNPVQLLPTELVCYVFDAILLYEHPSTELPHIPCCVDF